MASSALTLGAIMDRLSKATDRPRYAFMVLSLLAEQANDNGKAGPFVGAEDLPLREWIGRRMAAISGHDARRRALEARVRKELQETGQLSDDLLESQMRVDREVQQRAAAIGADNFSRVITELERSGYLRRHYEGYRTNHRNRGGRRTLACTLDPDVFASLRRRDVLI